MKKINSKGFTLIEGLLIIIALCMIGGVGFYVYNANKDNPSQTSSDQPTQNSDSTKSQATLFSDQNKVYSFEMPNKWSAKYLDYSQAGIDRVGAYPAQYLELTAEDFKPANGNPSIANIETFKLDGSGTDGNGKPISNLDQLITYRKYQFGEEDSKATSSKMNGATVWRLEQNTKDTSATGPPELNGAYHDVYYIYSKNGTDIVQLNMRVSQNASTNYQGTKILDAFDNSEYVQGFEAISKSLKIN